RPASGAGTEAPRDARRWSSGSFRHRTVLRSISLLGPPAPPLVTVPGGVRDGHADRRYPAGILRHYLSLMSTPLAASVSGTPWVAELTRISPPCWFFITTLPAPSPSVAPASAAA